MKSMHCKLEKVLSLQYPGGKPSDLNPMTNSSHQRHAIKECRKQTQYLVLSASSELVNPTRQFILSPSWSIFLACCSSRESRGVLVRL